MPILGFTSLLISQPEKWDDKDSVKDQLKIIRTAAEDAAAVVGRLREFYRQRDETDQFSIISLNELVNQAVSLTQARWKGQAQAKGVNVEVETKLDEIPSIMGNAPEIREALINLILNAVDAMPDGGTITLQTYVDVGHIALVVSDTGNGMTEEVRRRCLEPFFTTKGAHGTGMGLAMVYGIVQRHRGTLDIQSAVGQGTSFLIRLPVHSESFNVMNTKMKTQGPPHKLHVLVVDDEPIVQQLLIEYLSCDGHTVETAANGHEGLEKFRAGAFDLVLTDRAMPQMNGDQLAVAVKGLAPEKPVILLTGFADIMAATNERPKGVDLVLGKPLTIMELRQALAKVMDTVDSAKLTVARAAWPHISPSLPMVCTE
jgi:CheY-like chemotaxis protein